MEPGRARAVVVTGAAGDMGSALCRVFLAGGYLVYGADIATVEPVSGLLPVMRDVTDRAAVQALADRVAAEALPWAWVNGAGIFVAGPVREASTAEWDRIIAVNLTGTFHGCSAALPMLAAAGGGRIVNIGSLSGQIGGVAVHPAYGASKAGVHALTKTYALEGARHGVLCNAVAPGLLEGRMTSQFADRQRAKMVGGTPLQRFGRMEEVAEAVRFLADPANTYITGAIVPVNGGSLMPG